MREEENGKNYLLRTMSFFSLLFGLLLVFAAMAARETNTGTIEKNDKGMLLIADDDEER
jgi:hypothetical protein